MQEGTCPPGGVGVLAAHPSLGAVGLCDWDFLGLGTEGYLEFLNYFLFWVETALYLLSS